MQTREQDAHTGAGNSRTVHIREREQPEPSVVWQAVAIFLLGTALAAGMSALMVSKGAIITGKELWFLSGAFIVWAATCFLAHWDVNRGRKIKTRQIEEVSGDG
jgi:membrane protein implicated in regulation of membrane protease activity